MSVTLAYPNSVSRTVLHYVEAFSRALISFFKNGSQATLAYSSFRYTRDVYAISFTYFGQFQRLRCIVPSDLLASPAVMETWADHSSLLLMVTARYGNYQPVPTLHHRRHFLWGGLFLCEMVTILYLERSALLVTMP